jgi:signal transduction histidine kinase
MFLVLGCCAQPALAQFERIKTVLVLYDGGREFASIQLTDRNIEATLNHALPGRITIFREYMDLTRISSPNYEDVLRDFVRSKYSANRPDVIIAIRGRPLDFVLKDGDPLFSEVPIVSAAMDRRQVAERHLPSNVTGRSLQIKYWPTLLLARALQPETEHVAVVLGASPNDRALESLVRDEFQQHDHELTFTYLAALPIDVLLQRVRNLPPRTVILFVSFAQDADGQSFIPNDVLTRIAAAANAPTYINSDDVVDGGVVGGDVISFAALGRDTAALALRILGGESPAAIPFTENTYRVITLDARQLDRWGINSARVPAGAVVLNRVPPIWEAYRWQIVTAVCVTILQSALIAALLIQRRRRRIAEHSLLVSEANSQTAVLEERNRMARDMHDTLAQGFTGVIVQLEAAKQAFAHGAQVETDEHVNRASELARQSLGEARRSIRALRPEVLENSDLCVALHGVVKQMAAGTAVRAEFVTSGRPRALIPSIEESLFRIHQEILTNALKHSGAKTIKTTLSFEEDAVRLEVQDDGRGFDPQQKHDGLGLLGIRERVHQISGHLTVDSRLGIGTMICVALPSQGNLSTEIYDNG